MGGIFGKDKKPASRITEQDEAILVREKLCIRHKLPVESGRRKLCAGAFETRNRKCRIDW